MLGARIQEMRLTRGMNRSDFARLVGVTPTGAWNWEEGHTQPRSATLTAIARVLGTNESYLKTGTDAGTAPAPRGCPEIIAQAERDIAKINGIAPARVKITVQILPA